MGVFLTVLLALPAGPPAGPLDGDWTIVSVNHNGKTTDAQVRVSVHRNRLVLNEGQGEPITIEFAANHRAWMWAGKNKPPTQPPPPEKVPLAATGRVIHGPNGVPYVFEPGSRMATEAQLIELPAKHVTLAEPGFYLSIKDQLQIFFLPVDGNGPSLSLVMQRLANRPDPDR